MSEACGYYFAYAANLNHGDMGVRCPDAVPVGKAVLSGYRLVFRQAADIEKRPRGAVHGGLWRITGSCEHALDAFEVYPSLYDKRLIPVTAKDGSAVEALVYLMVNRAPLSPPTREYLRVVKRGYEDFGLSEAPLRLALMESRRKAVLRRGR